MSNKPKFTIGKCIRCGKNAALKDGICVGCEKVYKNIEMPEFFKDLFGKFNEEKK